MNCYDLYAVIIPEFRSTVGMERKGRDRIDLYVFKHEAQYMIFFCILEMFDFLSIHKQKFW